MAGGSNASTPLAADGKMVNNGEVQTSCKKRAISSDVDDCGNVKPPKRTRKLPTRFRQSSSKEVRPDQSSSALVFEATKRKFLKRLKNYRKKYAFHNMLLHNGK